MKRIAGWAILGFLGFMSLLLIGLGGVSGFKPEANVISPLMVVLAIIGAVMVLDR